ncbi:peptidylprolyl isomerase [Spirillospora sp. CA-294931]|uniref:peptidylprolyl isomerase n=1 Tax=Spirillospora sp. CA-294931 TaxID=3240042 RepID=UPI003D8ACCE4
MAGKDRKKQLARQRYERQQQAREAAAAKARRMKIVGTVVAVVIILGAGAGIAAFVGKDDDSKASPKPTESTPPPTDGAPKQDLSFQKVSVTGDEGGTAKCTYPDSKDKGAPKGLGKPPATASRKGKVNASITTNLGEIKLELDADKAPCTTNSFAFLAEKKYYEKTKCHRLTAADPAAGSGLSVLQCGDPTGSAEGGPGYRFANENTKGAKYTRGTLAMAHSAQPDSNGSQFFIVYKDSELPPEYTIFGKITAGMDVVDKVAGGGIAAK